MCVCVCVCVCVCEGEREREREKGMKGMYKVHKAFKDGVCVSEEERDPALKKKEMATDRRV